jgi:membrane-bound ClpP family serine protease
VRESASLSASDALARKVIDLIAVDVATCCASSTAACFRLAMPGPQREAGHRASPVVTLEPDWREPLLA